MPEKYQWKKLKTKTKVKIIAAGILATVAGVNALRAANSASPDNHRMHPTASATSHSRVDYTFPLGTTHATDHSSMEVGFPHGVYFSNMSSYNKTDKWQYNGKLIKLNTKDNGTIPNTRGEICVFHYDPSGKNNKITCVKN